MRFIGNLLSHGESRTRSHRAILFALLAGTSVACLLLPTENEPVNEFEMAGDTLLIIPIGGSVVPNVTITSDGKALPDQHLEFQSLSLETVVIDSAGAVRGLRRGTATVSVRWVNSGREWLDSLQAKVVVASVEVVPDSTDTLTALGDVASFSAFPKSGGDSAAVVADTVTIAWSSSDSNVAAVDSTGRVTAIGNGSATVTGTAVWDSMSGAHVVTVKQIPVHLAFTELQRDTTAGDTLAAVVVQLQDARGNAVTLDPDGEVMEQITVAFANGTNEEGATVSGTTTVNVDWTKGIASCSTLSVDKAGSYALEATPSGMGFNLTAVTSSPALRRDRSSGRRCLSRDEAH